MLRYLLNRILQMIRTALSHRDLSHILDSKRVMFFWKPEKGDFFA